MKKILYLEPDEEITTIISRLKKVDADSVGLVIPRDATIIQSLVNLKLLKKEAAQVNKKITLVTTDKIGQNLASQIGLTVYSKLEPEMIEETPEEPAEIEKISKEPSIKLRQIKYKKKTLESERIPDQKLIRKIPIETETPKIPSRINKRIIFGFLIFLIFAVALTLFIILPRAEIILALKSEPFKKDLEITLDKSIKKPDFSKSIIPAEYIEVTKESGKKATATGTKETGAKAQGKVIVYNYWDSAPQSFPATTAFSYGNLIFLSSAAFTVPGTTIQHGDIVPGSTEVTLVAQQNGEAYNVGPGRFNITNLSGEQASKIYGQSSQNFSGGYKKIVKVVSQTDIDQNAQSLAEQLSEQTKKELKEKIKNDKDKMILDQAIINEITQKNSNPQQDQEATEFDLKITLKSSTLTFLNKDFEEMINKNLEKELPKDKILVDLNLAQAQIQIKNKAQNLDWIELKIFLLAKIAPKLDEKKLKENIIGRTSPETIGYLKSFSEIADAQIKFWPFWVKKVPAISNNIKISVTYAEK